MVISHYGLGFVKIQQGDKIIALNPIGQNKDYKPVRFGADIVVTSFNDENYNGVSNMAWGDRNPLIIDGPGEYEVGGIFIHGWPIKIGGKINTVYLIIWEGVRLAHLGALNTLELPSVVKEGLGVVDILFVPVGGCEVLDAKQASKIISLLGPAVVVPINYTDKSLRNFLDEIGEKNGAPMESWQIKKKDLAGKEEEIVVIKSF